MFSELRSWGDVWTLLQFTWCRLTNDESSQEKSTLISKDGDGIEGAVKKLNKKCRPRVSKADALLDCGVDADGDQPSQGASSSREEKVSSLKTVSPILHVVVSLVL